ncbi:Clp protease N-terminal domain-containing protein [Streptomyces sp. Ru72]|uniref:Clp protease N-terminal domain-containing protein n=1 Tax=Streptomyces sp. Ru72 TaxID=2080747 RepID=UPI000CDDA221|nr:Clp protease N-terminal domain-containing protein [Streptomyces sp. Ru72]POX51386.1 peptidase [Streptomyces sp. Ru72]
MFERFTQDARAVVTGAVAHCERAGGQRVDEAHLLLALLESEGGRAAFALAALGVAGRRDAIERDLAEARRRGGLTRADADALSGLGIDLTEIVSRVEEAHGEGALAATHGVVRRSGRRPFSRGAKDVLTRSLRAALAHGDRRIGDEHLLLALTARPGVPSEVLADHGVTYAGVQDLLWDGSGRAKAG